LQSPGVDGRPVGKGRATTNQLTDGQLTASGPTEDDENLDSSGEHGKDTGDEA
jgi:hypothetical protein